MSTDRFLVHEHRIPGQHVREYPAATAHKQEDVLYLEIKQYSPRSNASPSPGDVTIIGAHANGFPKELYEPLWDELLARAETNGFKIRDIWIADVAHQGYSGVVNENVLGNDPSWHDHARDLLHMINHFRDQMPRPLMGIGHSMGAASLATLSLMHPRLLTSLILLDPVIFEIEHIPARPDFAIMSTFRRDRWPSRPEAEASFRKSPVYKRWDKRVLDRWIQHGLRELPTAIYPDAGPGLSSSSSSTQGITLRTALPQELHSYSRLKVLPTDSQGLAIVDRDRFPDLPSGKLVKAADFYRPEPVWISANLPHIRPSVLWIFGAESPISPPITQDDKMARTGTGVGGSGGAGEGRVSKVVVARAGHLVAMEAVAACAEASAGWIGAEMRRWRAQEEQFKVAWTDRPHREKITVSEEWKVRMGGDPRARAKNGKKAAEKGGAKSNL